MTITLHRMERLRRARSLNDVLSIGKEIEKDITKASNMSKVLGVVQHTSLSAISLKFNRDKILELPKKPTKVSVGPKKSKSPTSGMGHQLAEFKAPPVAQILKHSAVVHSLQENLYELESAAALIRTTFARQKNQGPALKSVSALVKEAKATLEATYNALSFIAQKHLPPEMTLLGEELRSFLIDNLERKNFSNLSTKVYVTAGDTPSAQEKLPHQEFGGSHASKLTTLSKKTRASKEKLEKEDLARDILFSFYIDIEDLRDASGAVIAHYYVILTGVIGQAGVIRYFLTALPEFRAPGLYNPGMQVQTSEAMIHRLTLLLANNDITSTIEKKPMPINTADAARRGFNNIAGVENVYVADDSLWVVLEPAKGAALEKLKDKVIGQVFPLLNRAIGNHRRSSIKHTLIERDDDVLLQFSKKDTAIEDRHLKYVKKSLDVAGVTNIYLAGNSLYVSLDTKKDQTKLQAKVVAAVTPLLNEVLFNSPRSSSVIKYKDIKRSGKNLIQFFLTPSAKGGASSMNAEQLNELQSQLGIEPHVMEDIRRVLRRHQ